MPGWDGLETVHHIRQIDRQAEVVFVTAYSDNTIEQVVQRAGPNVGYHLKPFAPEEIKQIATKAVYDWNKLRRLEKLIDLIGTLKVNTKELDTLLDHVFHQVIGWIGTDSAMLAQKQEDGQFEALLATGALQQGTLATQHLELLAKKGMAEDRALEKNFIRFQVERYDLVALIEKSASLNSEKLYLLELFVRHAGQAIENLRLHEAILKAEKLAAVGLAIGKIAHDLRSPVGAIQGAIELIRQERGDQALLEEMLEVMYRSSEDALALANDLLSFTKNAAASMKSFPVVELFRALRQRMEAKLELHGISLQLNAENVRTIHADANKLQRALLNLLQNAAEALEASGTARPAIRVNVSRDGDVTRFEVADNGPGIPAAIRSKLFEPFVTQGKPSGTGLGLAIVRQAVEAHGGAVSVVTSEAGTRFVILLPPHQQSLPELDQVINAATTSV